MKEYLWRPTSDQVRVIKEYTAKHLRISPSALRLDAGVRINLSTQETSMNVLLVDVTEDWEESDLFDLVPFNTRTKITTYRHILIVDIYCYHIRTGELLTNTQAFGTVNPSGVFTLVSLNGTDSPEELLDTV